MKKVKVMIIDDSSLVRLTLSEIFSTDENIEVIAKASDPYDAVQQLKTLVPDVITLDIEMPKMNGITFLKKLMAQHPIPVVVISSLTERGTETALSALEYGAVEVLGKPKTNTESVLKEESIKLCDTIKGASKVKVKRVYNDSKISPSPKLTADAILSKPTSENSLKTTNNVIVIGASTGGTKAIKIVLQDMPIDCPGIVIVQHMPKMFTKQFADRLNAECKIVVKEAKHGDKVLKGQALIAPGSHHLLLKRDNDQYYVQLKDGPLVSRHRPSVDVLFRSAARYAGANAIGILLTGMGDDGAKGLLEMKNEGAHTIAQDEKSCIIYGMPKEAIKLNAQLYILGIEKITNKVIQMTKLCN